MLRSVTEFYGDPPPSIDLSTNQEILDDSVAAVLTIIATLAIAFRIIYKKRKGDRSQGDDWFILIALACLVGVEHESRTC
jgi:nitrate reductase gamma subunit